MREPVTHPDHREIRGHGCPSRREGTDAGPTGLSPGRAGGEQPGLEVPEASGRPTLQR